MAVNPSRRKGHPKEDLEQVAMVGIILAARCYANGEVHYCLRDEGLLVKVTPVGGSCTP